MAQWVVRRAWWVRLIWVLGSAVALAACSCAIGGPQPAPPFGQDSGTQDAAAGAAGFGGIGGAGGVAGTGGTGGTGGDSGMGGYGDSGGEGGGFDAGAGTGGLGGVGGFGGHGGTSCEPTDDDAGENPLEADACVPNDAGIPIDASTDGGVIITGFCALPMVCQVPQCTSGTAHPELLCLGIAQCCEL